MKEILRALSRRDYSGGWYHWVYSVGHGPSTLIREDEHEETNR